MPELPEVQTVVNDLQKSVGDTVIGFWTGWEKAIKQITPIDFKQKITGQKIASIRRLGKFIIIDLEKNISIVIHLRMTGQLLFTKKLELIDEKYRRHIHHIFYLKKNKILAFSDIRKFATIALIKTDTLSTHKSVSSLGIDAIDLKLNVKKLSQLLVKHKNKQIKDFLMRQEIISGIGNIYASEILFEAKIKPTRLCKNITNSEIEALSRSIKRILEKAIELRGTSVSDYRDSSGKEGLFQNMTKVYKKSGQKCKTCDTIIEKIIIGQRSTFFCSHCQI